MSGVFTLFLHFSCRLPEIPNDTTETNSILRTNELVDYKSVTAETCMNAVAKLSLEQESGIWKLENQITGLLFIIYYFINSSPK